MQALFESYFGLLMKFVNPAALTLLLTQSLANDFEDPYGNYDPLMQVYASIFVFVMITVIIVPMFMCDYEENFDHNVKSEFAADDVYEIQLKLRDMGLNKSKVNLQTLKDFGKKQEQPNEANSASQEGV